MTTPGRSPLCSGVVSFASRLEICDAPRVFRFAKVQLELELLDDHAPTGWWGARLRGGYGTVLKTGLCDHPDLEDCRTCPRFGECDYPRLFEPVCTAEQSRRADAPLKRQTSLPRAYVLEPPLPDARPHYDRGERLRFGFVSLGALSERIEYPVRAFEAFGAHWIEAHGQRRVRFRVVNVTDELNEGRSVDWQGRLEAVTICDIRDYLDAQPWSQQVTTLAVRFLTPVRIEADQARWRDPVSGLACLSDAYDLIYHLSNRVGGLWQLYGTEWPGQAEFYRWRERLLKAARAVQFVEDPRRTLRMAETDRYSNRQQQRLMLDGFVGSLQLAGDLAPLIELLRLGEIVHLGQATAFGLGQYQISLDKSDSSG